MYTQFKLIVFITFLQEKILDLDLSYAWYIFKLNFRRVSVTRYMNGTMPIHHQPISFLRPIKLSNSIRLC